MSFAEWQSLSPSAAARLCHARLAALPAAQHHAAVASLAPADVLAARLAAGDPAAPLRGLPYFLKDLFAVAREPMFAGSTFLPQERPLPAQDSFMVRRLREYGAALAGKAHLHEFAYGLTGENPHYGDCEHPRFPGRTTGGSSSGSAALVAAGVVPFAVGTDTGCSVRLPAAFCGLYGFRLTPGDAWISDAFPLAPTFDTAGWFTRCGGDMQTLLHTLVGFEGSAREPRGFWLDWPDLDPALKPHYRAAAEKLAVRADPAMQRELTAGFAPAATAYSVIVAQEAWATHAPWFDRHSGHYDPNVRARLESARHLTPARIESARAALTAVRRLWTQVFLSCDFLILPAAPTVALTKADCTVENRQRIIDCNAPASLGGLPVLTIHVPLPDGLSLGLQLVAPHPQSAAIPWALGARAVRSPE
jgi:amidase/aspartyl-tRNA(Asn)/glutamyl-tRNA(Gln) amidotransferase subunit A